jgi:hypothetical protein
MKNTCFASRAADDDELRLSGALLAGLARYRGRAGRQWRVERPGETRRDREIGRGVGRSGEIWGDLGRSGEMRGGMGRSGEIWGDLGRCGEMRGDAGRSGEITERLDDALERANAVAAAHDEDRLAVSREL